MAADCIRIRQIRVFGHHGVYAEERTQGQPFEVDLELRADLRTAGVSDDISGTIDYVAVYRLVERIVAGPPKRLLETLGETIAREILETFPVTRVTVRLRKPRVRMPGPVGAVEVELTRP